MESKLNSFSGKKSEKETPKLAAAAAPAAVPVGTPQPETKINPLQRYDSIHSYHHWLEEEEQKKAAAEANKKPQGN